MKKEGAVIELSEKLLSYDLWLHESAPHTRGARDKYITIFYYYVKIFRLYLIMKLGQPMEIDPYLAYLLYFCNLGGDTLGYVASFLSKTKNVFFL